ncbi:MAG: glycosyltransferase [Planctomycetota bacterium]
MKISIIIPTCNGMPLFGRVLDRIAAQHCSLPYCVSCVDSESDDGTWEELGRRGIPRTRIRRSEFNHGGTRNLAFRETDGDLIVSTVQDATPRDEHWLQSLVDAVLSADDVAGAYSRQLPYETVNPFIRRRLESWAAGRTERVVQRLPEGRSLADLPPLEQLALCAFDDVSSIMHRSVWREFPLPVRRFGEDVAWGRQVIAAGKAIVYEPASTVIHSHETRAMDEFRRIYLDHANLHELFGLTTVPSFRAALGSSRSQARLYRDLVDRLDLKQGERKNLLRLATRLALAETFAQWLGARSVRKGPPRGLFAILERCIAG